MLVLLDFVAASFTEENKCSMQPFSLSSWVGDMSFGFFVQTSEGGDESNDNIQGTDKGICFALMFSLVFWCEQPFFSIEEVETQS